MMMNQGTDQEVWVFVYACDGLVPTGKAARPAEMSYVTILKWQLWGKLISNLNY